MVGVLQEVKLYIRPRCEALRIEYCAILIGVVTLSRTPARCGGIHWEDVHHISKRDAGVYGRQ